ncbi:MAG TPA: hypothetical protein DEQ03_08240 [Marinilabiliales bacterium]|nr:hypothetical protein [Marinilabiliales bacterium]
MKKKDNSAHKIIFLSIGIFLLISFNSFSQDIPAEKSLLVKLPLTSSIFGDVMTESAALGMGIESFINPRYSFNQDILYVFHVLRDNNLFVEPVEKINGIKSNTGLRRYFSKQYPQSGFFVSADWLNLYTHCIKKNGEFEWDVNRFRTQLTVNPGLLVYNQPNKTGVLTFELLAGAGVGYVFANTDIDKSLIPNDSYSKPGLYPWINLDFKIGFKLK